MMNFMVCTTAVYVNLQFIMSGDEAVYVKLQCIMSGDEHIDNELGVAHVLVMMILWHERRRCI